MAERVATLALAAAFAATLLPLLPRSAAAAAPVDIPLDQYPVAAPSPVGDSRPPAFLDEDETVRAHLAPDGRVTSLVDDALLKLRGSGDYVIFLPAKVTQVNDLRGDIPPGLQGGRVSFLGNLVGQSQLGAEATLDLSAARTMPLRVALSYTARGRAIAAAAIPGATSPVTVSVDVTNVTGAPHEFTRASALPGSLAPVLENLRRVPSIYTPETDLQAQFPMPATLRAAAPAVVETHDTFVPLALTLTARLGAGATVVDAGGAEVISDPQGTRLNWSGHLPADPGRDVAQRTFTFTFAAAHPRLPGLDLRADPLPFPSAMFTPPGGGAWADFLPTVGDRSELTLLVQQAATSLHRIGELVQPLGRPGPGPVKVKYDFILDSGQPPVAAPAPQPVRGDPLVIVLVVSGVAFAIANAAWAWARH